MTSRRSVVLAAAICTAGLLSSLPASSQSLDPDLWGTDGFVWAVACSGHTVYVGGSFTSLGPITGGGVPLVAATGDVAQRFPKVAGSVSAAVSDGEGGWFIGGYFTSVAGAQHVGLAHVLVDGSVAAWDPRLLSPNNVLSLALSGNTLYVGGQGLRKAWNSPATSLAAVDTRTAEFLPWDPDVRDWVFALAVEDTTVYAGGYRLTAVDTRTAAVRDWKPNPSDVVRAIAIRGNTIYVAGDFTMIGSAVPRVHLAALDARTGTVTDWNPDPDGTVSAIALDETRLLVGGDFSSIGGLPRRNIAAVDLETGAATPWVSSVVFAGVTALAVDRNRVCVGGVVVNPDGTRERAIVAMRGPGRAEKSWVDRIDQPTSVLVAGRDRVYAGGDFTTVGPRVARANLAALDANTGRVTDWDPHPNGAVRALLAEGGTVWAGGSFTRISGQARGHLAALDARTGEAMEADPGLDGDVAALGTDGALIFVGGGFRAAAGSPRRNLAAFDAATGALTPWDPGTDGPVAAIATRGSTVYVAGTFDSAGVDGSSPQARASVAALDATTGAVMAWAPIPSGDFRDVNAVAVGEHGVYLAGNFFEMNGEMRAGFAAVDPVTGAVTPWQPGASYVSGPVRGYGLGVNGSHVYLSGLFSFVGGPWRLRVGVVDDTTGRAIAWDPRALGEAYAFAVGGGTVYAGGILDALGGYPVGNVAAIEDRVSMDRHARRAGAPELAGSAAIALEQNDPNPARGGTTIRFTLPATAAVTLAVYDLQGRRVAAPLDRERQPAGAHEVPVRTGGWPAGCYLYRLEAGGLTATRKLVVVR